MLGLQWKSICRHNLRGLIKSIEPYVTDNSVCKILCVGIDSELCMITVDPGEKDMKQYS